MKVFYFCGEIAYNYGQKHKIEGYFLQEEENEVRGYVCEEGTKYSPNAIKGIYHKEDKKLIFVKTSTPSGYKPEMWIFDGEFDNGWLSSYNDNYKTFSVYGGIRNGVVKLTKLKMVFATSKNANEILDKFNTLYEDSSKLSKELIQDVKKYLWLFNFIKHLKGSAI